MRDPLQPSLALSPGPVQVKLWGPGPILPMTLTVHERERWEEGGGAPRVTYQLSDDEGAVFLLDAFVARRGPGIYRPVGIAPAGTEPIPFFWTHAKQLVQFVPQNELLSASVRRALQAHPSPLAAENAHIRRHVRDVAHRHGWAAALEGASVLAKSIRGCDAAAWYLDTTFDDMLDDASSTFIATYKIDLSFGPPARWVPWTSWETDGYAIPPREVR